MNHHKPDCICAVCESARQKRARRVAREHAVETRLSDIEKRLESLEMKLKRQSKGEQS